MEQRPKIIGVGKPTPFCEVIMKTIKLLILVFALLIGTYGALQAQTNVEKFRNIQVSHNAKLLGGLDVNGAKATLDTDGDTSITADTDDQIDFESGGSDIAKITSGGVTVNSGGLTLTAGALILGQQSEVVTTSWIITPTAPYIVMTSIGAATSATANGIITTTATAGQVLILLNGNASDALTLDGTGGTVECKANVVLGAGDTVTLIYEATDLVWYCLAGYDNS